MEVGLNAALEDRGLTGVTDYLLGDGVLGWPGNGWVVGPANTQAVLAGQPAADSTLITLEMLRLTLSQDSTTAVVEGVAALKRTNVRPVRLGRYVAAWQRMEGEWRLRLFLPVGLFDIRETVPVAPRLQLAPPVTAKTVHAADSTFWATARRDGMSAAYATHADSTAIWSFTGTGELAIGLTAVQGAIRTLAGYTWLGRPLGAAASPDGSVGWAVGELVVANPADNAVASYAAYATFWQRGPDGKLRLRSIASVPRQ